MSDDDTSVSEGEMELGSEDEGDMPYKPPAGQTKKISEAISKTPARSNKPPKRSAAGSTTSYDEKSHSEDEKEGVATPIQKPGAAYWGGNQISGCQIGKTNPRFAWRANERSDHSYGANFFLPLLPATLKYESQDIVKNNYLKPSLCVC